MVTRWALHGQPMSSVRIAAAVMAADVTMMIPDTTPATTGIARVLRGDL